ncbi:MAG TPA: GNAT family N-acetyltransferase [Silvibacterium sp.]|nr:GNAT family N-acetyltransferase [Silvibacterium sp.]
MPDAVECGLCRTTGEFIALRSEWGALWRDDPHATPFQSPEWLLPWWHQFGQPQLRLVTIRRSGDLIGLLPFYLYQEPRTQERQLLPIGVGTSDYLDGIFRPDCMIEHIQQALDLICDDDQSWDALYISQLRPQSKLMQAMQLDSRNYAPTTGESCSQMPAVGMSDLPQKIRRNAMYYRNRAMRLGKLELTLADDSSVPATFDALRGLHRARWEICKQPGVLADKRVLAWHRESLQLLQKSGMLRLYRLTLSNEIIGVLYALVDPPSRPHRTQYFYLPAYSTAHAELRPGTLLTAFAIDSAAAEGVQTIDMLRGDEPYKRIWHLQPVATYGFAARNEAQRAA